MLSNIEIDVNQNINWLKAFLALFFLELILLLAGIFQPLILILTFVAFFSAILFYLLFVKEPFVWICLLLFASGLEVWGRITENITVFHVIYVLSLIGFSCYILFQNKVEQLIIDTPINKYILAYLGFALFSLIYSPNVESGMIYISVTFALFVFFLLIVNFVKSDLHLRLVVFTLLLMNTFITLLLIYQFIRGDFIPGVMDATVSTGGFKFYRAVGTFSDPNVAATFIATGVILAFSLLIHSRDRFIVKLFYL
ncbi:MAG: hypothetical protein OQK57_10220, partial [Ignavibacteriaceae bacterium]|nr:hypothetical protein [Ignavibacteriaceae bacterium]